MKNIRTNGTIFAKHIFYKSKAFAPSIAKAKANAVQGIPEMIEIATGKYYEENRKEKHSKDAKYGWYKYESKFALPVYDREGNVERYNIFNVLMVMRCSKEHKMYLYDIIEIKKK